MAGNDPRNWMWSEALQMLADADRLHRQIFRPQVSTRGATWEPPVDMLETETAVLILAALPGVNVDEAQAVIEDGALVISGERVLPEEVRTATIHRLELPQGRFERRIDLPPGRYESVRRTTANGCLVVTLSKTPQRRARP
jgi:HSP20 family protein